MKYAPDWPPADWGVGRLTRGELLTLGGKLHRAWTASVRQADQSPGAAQMREFFAVGAEMCWLWGEAADELIVRGERAAQAPEAPAAREAEAGS